MVRTETKILLLPHPPLEEGRPPGQNGIHQVPYEILAYLTFVDDEDRNGTLVFWCCLLIARLSA